MQRARPDAQRAQRAHASHAEHDVLREPDARVAHIETRADPTVELLVLGAFGVEQEERHAPDLHTPDLHLNLALANRDAYRDRLAVLPPDEGRGQAFRIGVDPVLVLPAGGVDPLPEVPLPVQETDGHERQRAVGGLLDEVAGEGAQAAGVDRQRHMDPVFRAEERHWTVPLDLAVPGTLELLTDGGLEPVSALDQLAVARRSVQRGHRRLFEQAHGVLETALPAVWIDGAEQGRTSRMPAPAVVVGEARKRLERLWNPLGQLA